MNLEVTYNKSKKREELLFSEELSQESELLLKETIGLRKHYQNPRLWLSVDHPAYHRFVQDLENAIEANQPIQSVGLRPSFLSSSENIDKNKFSYVIVKHEVNDTTTESDFVVFDSYKKVAAFVAEAFGREKFGSAFRSVEVHPRNYKVKARQLLKEGKVINPEESKESTTEKSDSPKKESTPDLSKPKTEYFDLVIAHMHYAYAEGTRVTKGQIEKLAKELNVPNMGMMWEAVELSWLLWYRMIYREPIPFEQRLFKMTRFWEKIQPTYAYSDSSKEVYKQYSTSCPISAIIAQYTGMDVAEHVFEPSAGNGLLLLGADPQNVHANEIDKTRLKSLWFQGFETITSFNASKPFPKELDGLFDVVVTNPPFARWDDDKYDKEQIVKKYFQNHIGLAQHMKLEHLMSGLALHTLKDKGRAALIIMGHQYFDPKDGLLAKYRPFFNWLFRHYRVDDVINMNSFKLYNKQGAVEKMMLILISGRKQKPSGASPTQTEAPHFYEMVNSFQELWERVRPHIKSDLDTLIDQLKTEVRK